MPECVQCGENYPASEMRRVEWEHRVGSTYGRSSGSRTDSGNSYSSGRPGNARFTHSNSSGQSSRSTTRDHTRIDRVWVCSDCKPPRNYGWFQRALIFWGIVAAVIYFGAQWVMQNVSVSGLKMPTASERTTDQGSATTEPAYAPGRDSRSFESDTRSSQTVEPKPKPSVVFAPSKEVVQPVDDQTSQPVVKCTVTIRDHCSE